jgi:hypothetical protein
MLADIVCGAPFPDALVSVIEPPAAKLRISPGLAPML